MRAGEIQHPYTEGRDEGGLVVGVVIAGGSSSQDGSLFLLHAIIASALAIRLTFRLEVPSQASKVSAGTVRILDGSFVSLVGLDGFIGDIGEGVTVGHTERCVKVY